MSSTDGVNAMNNHITSLTPGGRGLLLAQTSSSTKTGMFSRLLSSIGLGPGEEEQAEIDTDPEDSGIVAALPGTCAKDASSPDNSGSVSGSTSSESDYEFTSGDSSSSATSLATNLSYLDDEVYGVDSEDDEYKAAGQLVADDLIKMQKDEEFINNLVNSVEQNFIQEMLQSKMRRPSTQYQIADMPDICGANGTGVPPIKKMHVVDKKEEFDILDKDGNVLGHGVKEKICMVPDSDDEADDWDQEKAEVVGIDDKPKAEVAEVSESP